MPGVLLLFVEVLAAPRSVRVPPTTIATNPAVALLETTVILINKQLHLCILLQPDPWYPAGTSRICLLVFVWSDSLL